MDPLIDDITRRLNDLEFLVSGLDKPSTASQDQAQDASLPPNVPLTSAVAALRQETAAALAPRIDTLGPLLQEIDALHLWKFLNLDSQLPGNEPLAQDQPSSSTTPQDPEASTVARESVLAALPSFAAVTHAPASQPSCSPQMPLTSPTALAPISLSPQAAALAHPATRDRIARHAQTLRALQAAVDALALESARLLDQYARLAISENETTATAHASLVDLERAKRKKVAAAAAHAAASKQYSRRSLTSADSSILLSSDY